MNKAIVSRKNVYTIPKGIDQRRALRIRCSNLFDLNGKKNKAIKLFLYVDHLIASGNEILSKNAMSAIKNIPPLSAT